MTKAELVEQLAEKTRVTKSAAETLVNAFVGAVTDALKKGEKVTLTGFGSFMVSQRKERKGRNPQTGEEITISGRSTPIFRAGKALKESIMNK
jgi:DNA-binding protein HU-beta